MLDCKLAQGATAGKPLCRVQHVLVLSLSLFSLSLSSLSHSHSHTHTHTHTLSLSLSLTLSLSLSLSLFLCRRHERRLYGAHHSPHAAVGRERQQDARLWQLQPWLAARPRHVRLRLRASRAISVYLAGAPERVWLLHLPARVSANGRSLAWRVGRLRPSVL